MFRFGQAFKWQSDIWHFELSDFIYLVVRCAVRAQNIWGFSDHFVAVGMDWRVLPAAAYHSISICSFVLEWATITFSSRSHTHISNWTYVHHLRTNQLTVNPLWISWGCYTTGRIEFSWFSKLLWFKMYDGARTECVCAWDGYWVDRMKTQYQWNPI